MLTVPGSVCLQRRESCRSWLWVMRADKHMTREDVPIPIVGKGLLYELKRVDGTWRIYDIGSNVVRPTPPRR